MSINKISIPGKMVQTDPVTLVVESITLIVAEKRAICFLVPEVQVGKNRRESWDLEIDITNPITEEFVNYITDLAAKKRVEKN